MEAKLNLSLEDALHKVQKITTEKYANSLENIDKQPDAIKEQIKTYIEKIIKDNNIEVKEFTNNEEELAKWIYDEIQGLVCLMNF